MIKKIFAVIAVIVIIAGCGSRYINPNPEFTWPEMATSKIGGQLGIYLPEDNIHYVYKSSSDGNCCKHKAIRVGKGLVKASEEASRSVFSHTIVLEGEPLDTYIKSLDLRGLLHVKDANFNIEFIPFVEEERGARNINKYSIKINLELKTTAIDFKRNDIRGFTINVSSESPAPVPRNRINKELKNLVDELFETASDHLAKELVIIYGARA